TENVIAASDPLSAEFPAVLRSAKRMGFSDAAIGRLVGWSAGQVREFRKAKNVLPTFQRVDTCAAEFAARTPYLYSAYETDDESQPTAQEDGDRGDEPPVHAEQRWRSLEEN
ncbi:MAG: carbamoyl-phosphate synthase large subunit, partial [Syntrophaceae bacterium]|nr:carbamoyl-phosphate synthase large subunit [Syntrophaceae bacterium]